MKRKKKKSKIQQEKNVVSRAKLHQLSEPVLGRNPSAEVGNKSRPGSKQLPG